MNTIPKQTGGEVGEEGEVNFQKVNNWKLLVAISFQDVINNNFLPLRKYFNAALVEFNNSSAVEILKEMDNNYCTMKQFKRCLDSMCRPRHDDVCITYKAVKRYFQEK
ncbi:hypothetical protein Ocin01_16957 [Orchesella cincta]|uniref:Uncharacterized protein n=1 Tax=Orchesella cincta TaxID=48709 RepID=A0A1D2M9R6_ORCCI|nr:hypothetical protein Ocin01_16957 [Orchesella cincta]